MKHKAEIKEDINVIYPYETGSRKKKWRAWRTLFIRGMFSWSREIETRQQIAFSGKTDFIYLANTFVPQEGVIIQYLFK